MSAPSATNGFIIHGWLCHCCGQVEILMNSKFTVWFCEPCKREVGLLNGRLGRCAVPIGCHSFHAGFALQGDATSVDVELFTSSWRDVTTAMSAVDRWAGEVVKRIVSERWVKAPKRIPLAEYLQRAVVSEEEKMRRFREMMEFLQNGG